MATMLGHAYVSREKKCEKRPKASGRRTPAKACAIPSSLIRTFWKPSLAANRRLRHWTGSADLPMTWKRSRARPEGPTAGGESHPALKTSFCGFAGKPAGRV